MLKSYTEYRKTKQKTALVSTVCWCYNKGQWNWQFSMLLCVVNIGSACLTQVCETVAHMLVTRITLMRNQCCFIAFTRLVKLKCCALGGVSWVEGCCAVQWRCTVCVLRWFLGPSHFELLNYSLLFLNLFFSHCILEMLTTYFFHFYKSHVFPPFPYERFVSLCILPCIFLPITCIGKAHSTVYWTSHHIF